MGATVYEIAGGPADSSLLLKGVGTKRVSKEMVNGIFKQNFNGIFKISVKIPFENSMKMLLTHQNSR